jgi:U6 snRNA-associated Sm-like protein LSm7
MAHNQNTAIHLAKLLDKSIEVKLAGGREVTGVLKGYDQLLNLVLDEAEERLRDAEDITKLSGEVRKLGLMVCRGNSVMVVVPADGTESIENPFLSSETMLG